MSNQLSVISDQKRKNKHLLADHRSLITDHVRGVLLR